jgi:hypothetical protein
MKNAAKSNGHTIPLIQLDLSARAAVRAYLPSFAFSATSATTIEPAYKSDGGS